MSVLANVCVASDCCLNKDTDVALPATALVVGAATVAMAACVRAGVGRRGNNGGTIVGDVAAPMTLLLLL